jgi:hypothetical protein
MVWNLMSNLGPQFEQLKMFYSPSEIGFDDAIDAEAYGDFETTLKHKLTTSKNTGLYDDIQEKGVRTPIQVIHDDKNKRKILGHGHHRYATALDIERSSNPDILVPVVHTTAKYYRPYGAPPGSPKVVQPDRSLEEYENFMDEQFGDQFGLGQGTRGWEDDYELDEDGMQKENP